MDWDKSSLEMRGIKSEKMVQETKCEFCFDPHKDGIRTKQSLVWFAYEAIPGYAQGSVSRDHYLSGLGIILYVVLRIK